MVYAETVTHPSINRAQRRVTTLIETDALPLNQANTDWVWFKVRKLMRRSFSS